MADILLGVRVGTFVVLKDADGMRHAVRHGAIMSISEEEGDVVTITLTGSRTALVRQAFDKVLTWFRLPSTSPTPPAGSPRTRPCGNR